jgi:hypothetical protein
MDYSSSLHDGENPAEASPWGSSPAPSPQHNRSTFNPTTESPGSPVMYDQNRSHVDNYTSDSSIVGSGGPDKPEDAGNAHPYDQKQGTGESNVVHPTQQSGEQQPPIHSEQQQGHPGQDAQRHQVASRPATRQGPHYKLQAKITGLERVGRKDPILRFDIHVRMSFTWLYILAPYANSRRLIFQLSELRSFVMSVALIQNLSNSQII